MDTKEQDAIMTMVVELPDLPPRLGAWTQPDGSVCFFDDDAVPDEPLYSTDNFDLAFGFVGGWIAAAKRLTAAAKD
jgi:hypothetical protein